MIMILLTSFRNRNAINSLYITTRLVYISWDYHPISSFWRSVETLRSALFSYFTPFAAPFPLLSSLEWVLSSSNAPALVFYQLDYHHIIFHISTSPKSPYTLATYPTILLISSSPQTSVPCFNACTSICNAFSLKSSASRILSRSSENSVVIRWR